MIFELNHEWAGKPNYKARILDFADQHEWREARREGPIGGLQHGDRSAGSRSHSTHHRHDVPVLGGKYCFEDLSYDRLVILDAVRFLDLLGGTYLLSSFCTDIGRWSIPDVPSLSTNSS